MKLTTDYNDEVIDHPDEDAILSAVVYTVENIAHLSGESVMLAPDPEDEDGGILLVQAMFDKDKPGWILLVDRRSEDGQGSECNQATEGLFSTTSIAEILQKHARGDVSWEQDLHWERAKTIRIETLIGILLAVIVAAIVVAICLFAFQ